MRRLHGRTGDPAPFQGRRAPRWPDAAGYGKMTVAGRPPSRKGSLAVVCRVLFWPREAVDRQADQRRRHAAEDQVRRVAAGHRLAQGDEPAERLAAEALEAVRGREHLLELVDDLHLDDRFGRRLGEQVLSARHRDQRAGRTARRHRQHLEMQPVRARLVGEPVEVDRAGERRPATVAGSRSRRSRPSRRSTCRRRSRAPAARSARSSSGRSVSTAHLSSAMSSNVSSGGTRVRVSTLLTPSNALHDSGWLAVSETKKPISDAVGLRGRRSTAARSAGWTCSSARCACRRAAW